MPHFTALHAAGSEAKGGLSHGRREAFRGRSRHAQGGSQKTLTLTLTISSVTRQDRLNIVCMHVT